MQVRAQNERGLVEKLGTIRGYKNTCTARTREKSRAHCFGADGVMLTDDEESRTT